METYDAAVIGGGLLGCFAARNLSRYCLSTVLIEREKDVCTGISKANTAIVYAGYDNRPGSLKAELTVRANRSFEGLCAELEVPFSRCGSLMVSCGEKADGVLRKKLENGIKNGVPGLEIISGDEARRLEPELTGNISSALLSPTTGTVDSWRLCYGAFENAVQNGCSVKLATELLGIKKAGNCYVLGTDRGEIRVRALINCAGLNADRVSEMLFPPSVGIFPDGGDYLILEREQFRLSHIVFHEREDGKGITAVPTVEGRILLGPTQRKSKGFPTATDPAGLEDIMQSTELVLNGLKRENCIRSFGAVRPNPGSIDLMCGRRGRSGRSIHDFVIEQPEEGFISFIGIKTPGLTCADELGRLAAQRLAAYLGAGERPDFDPYRKAIPSPKDMAVEDRRTFVEKDPDFGEIVCVCGEISKGEILEAIRRGAVSIDGVKRRAGAMLGVCQGGRCRYEIAKILAAELHRPAGAFLREADGSEQD